VSVNKNNIDNQKGGSVEIYIPSQTKKIKTSEEIATTERIIETFPKLILVLLLG